MECSAVWLGVTVSLLALGPFLAFLYHFSVYLCYAINHETPWTSKGKAMSFRLSLTIAAVAIALGLCQAISNDKSGTSSSIHGIDWWPYLVLGMTTLLSWILSVFLMKQTRRDDVVGIHGSPFYGGNALKEKLVLVTGANNGIGKETTYQLAEMGATIVLLCRSKARAETAVLEILRRSKSAFGNQISKEQLLVIPMDLGDFASIHTAVQSVREQFPDRSIDVLINNAGLMMGNQAISKDGCDLMMQANHLGHFLLTLLLMEQNLLRCSTEVPSRIINLTSSTYEMTNARGGFDFEDTMCDRGLRPYTLFGQYSMTKLANILFTKELMRQYDKLLVFAVHPGIVRTNVTSNMQWFWRIPNDIFGVFVAAIQKTPAEGAYSTVFVSAAPLSDLPPNGSYIINCRPYPTLPIADSEEDAKRLWKVSEALVGLNDRKAVNGKTSS